MTRRALRRAVCVFSLAEIGISNIQPGYGCLSLVDVVCSQVEFSVPDNSPVGILWRVLCLSDISKLRERRGHYRNTVRIDKERNKQEYNGRAERKIMSSAWYLLTDECNKKFNLLYCRYILLVMQTMSQIDTCRCVCGSMLQTAIVRGDILNLWKRYRYIVRVRRMVAVFLLTQIIVNIALSLDV
jgi:hypothetical protein